MIASPYFEPRIRCAGIEFTPLGAPGDFERLLQRPELWHPCRGVLFLLDELLQRLLNAFAVTAAISQRRDTVLADRWVAPRLNRVRAALGLAPVQRVLSRWMHSPDLVIGAWPDLFAPTQPDWPAQAQTSGFLLFHESSHGIGGGLAPSLEAFLGAGPAPIGITPGSAMAHGSAFFAQAVDACASNGQRALLITPFREQLPATLPAGAMHVPYAPFSALLARLGALVHHGGIGTSAQALAAGTAQLVVPFAHDQFDNAARLRRLGVAVTLNSAAPVADWRAAVRSLLDAPARAVALRCNAERMSVEVPAACRIADRLVSLGRQTR